MGEKATPDKGSDGGDEVAELAASGKENNGTEPKKTEECKKCPVLQAEVDLGKKWLTEMELQARTNKREAVVKNEIRQLTELPN